MTNIILLITTNLVSFFIGYKISNKISDKLLDNINNTGSFNERYAASIIKKKKKTNKII